MPLHEYMTSVDWYTVSKSEVMNNTTKLAEKSLEEKNKMSIGRSLHRRDFPIPNQEPQFPGFHLTYNLRPSISQTAPIWLKKNSDHIEESMCGYQNVNFMISLSAPNTLLAGYWNSNGKFWMLITLPGQLQCCLYDKKIIKNNRFF